MKSDFITQLNAIQGLKIECPHCGEEFSVLRAKLFNMYKKYPDYAENKLKRVWKELENRRQVIVEAQKELRNKRKEIREELLKKPKRIQVSTASINFGKIVEKIIPSFNDFPYNQRDCRQLFDPIDYIVFSNLHKNGNISSIVFVDVKSGNPQLNHKQREIKASIEDNQLKHSVIKEFENE